ncbi:MULTISPECIES: fimbrial protein [Providencia]|uniref:fimbrial protein n=1 Tax=Providencia TaxID=586 RepID=UPI000EF8E5B7|nr:MULTISPECIES: fimbrial protein [Providencia]MCR4081852.1 fimbrial protein [Providencia stuartii]MDN7225409.1 fimbrial protein [Providencia stuartii]QIB31655.1 fimbrial protein [Providencia stuartii]QPN40223.1 fimbrial protein [Providencia sp. 2.29]RMA06595.1 MrfE protein [Providencia stuartii]
MNNTLFVRYFIGLLCLLSPVLSRALDVYFTGTLVVTPPECTVNSGTVADVNFGDIHETLIDNSSYKRTRIDYTLNCTNVYSNALKMTVSWIPITLNGQNVIRTDRTNLGIAVYQDSTRLSNGDVVNFTYGSNQPALYAVPVKPSGTVLTDGGNFNGTLTFVVDYR